MANTFSQIYIQTVFAVESRQSIIKPNFKEELYKYVTGIVRGQQQKLIAINGMPDHVHMLIGLRPAMALADLVRDIKSDSATFVNKRQLVHGRFNWQEGYGILVRPFSARHDHSLHSQSGKASSKAVV